MDLEERFEAVVRRAYGAAGLILRERDATSLARVYADWAQDADEGVVQRLERALMASLGVRTA